MSEAPETAGRSDRRTILSGTAQNVVGIGIAAIAMLVVQILMTRTLGRDGFGAVTIMTQGAFVLSFATRAGMDMAVLREVAAAHGSGEVAHVRRLVARAAMAAAAVSSLVAALLFVIAAPVASVADLPSPAPVRAAALGLPFLALSAVWLGATRGLKIMRYTLYVFWAGQNLAWIALMLLLWQAEASVTTSVAAYTLSWAAAAAASWWSWHRESGAWPRRPLPAGTVDRLVRYAGPRAPAALLAQVLFWTDLFILTQFVDADAVGVYSAALRAAQGLMLFLTSVNLMFAPYVADLHHRKQRDALDSLYKTLTRWVVAATLPIFVVIAVAPADVMRIFGAAFTGGTTALLILMAGQLVNIATGGSGFVLIMVGRTGWDFVIYLGAVALDVALAVALCPRYGIEGAALANAIALAASNVVRLVAVRHFVHIQPFDARYLRLAAPAAGTVAVAWLVHELVPGGFLLRLAAATASALLVYGVAVVAAGITPEERAALRGRLRPSTG